MSYCWLWRMAGEGGMRAPDTTDAGYRRSGGRGRVRTLLPRCATPGTTWALTGSRNVFATGQVDHRRPAASLCNMAHHYGGHMLSENNLDLEIALRKIHELSMADGDLGY